MHLLTAIAVNHRRDVYDVIFINLSNRNKPAIFELTITGKLWL